MVDNDCVIVCLYVDDMLICDTSLNIVNSTKLFLSTNLDMIDLGEVNMILGAKGNKKCRWYNVVIRTICGKSY